MQSIRHTSIIVAILCATTASADVTAQQVWGKWNSQMDVYGQGFTTGGETMSGDTLTVSDVTIKMSDDEANITATIGDINLTENGDGTVTITMADSYPIEMDFIVEQKNVIFVDDVLYSGRTVNAALNAIQHYGRPEKVELAVLINRRFKRELPIDPDYVGLEVDTLDDAYVKVEWEAVHGEDIVYLIPEKDK